MRLSHHTGIDVEDLLRLSHHTGIDVGDWLRLTHHAGILTLLSSVLASDHLVNSPMGVVCRRKMV